MTLTFDNGSRRTYRGADWADGSVCLVASGLASGEVVERLLFGYASLPVHDEASRRAGLARIWQTPVGGRFNYTFFGGTGGGAAASMYRDTVSVLRREMLSVGGQQRETLVIAVEQEGMAGNTHLSTTTFWWDIETGAWLKREVALVRGSTTARNYSTTRLFIP